MVYLDTHWLTDGVWLNELRFDVIFITEFIAVIIILYVAFLPIKVTLIGLLNLPVTKAFKKCREF